MSRLLEQNFYEISGKQENLKCKSPDTKNTNSTYGISNVAILLFTGFILVQTQYKNYKFYELNPFEKCGVYLLLQSVRREITGLQYYLCSLELVLYGCQLLSICLRNCSDGSKGVIAFQMNLGF